MATERKKSIRHTSPKGIAQYPRLFGEADTKFDAAGVWSVKLQFPLSDPAVSKMVELFEGVIEQAGKNAKADEVYMTGLKKRKKTLAECDRSFIVDEDTGMVTATFKAKASGVSKKDNKPWKRIVPVFDRFGAVMPQETKLGSGSEMKVSFSAEPFHTAVGYGCSLRLEAAQVSKLVEWGSGNAAMFGFDADEADDAFGASEKAEEDTKGDETATDAEEATDDDF